MSQSRILEIIEANPGIEQSKIAKLLGRHESGGATGRQINQLVKHGRLRRVPIKRTFRLFVEGF